MSCALYIGPRGLWVIMLMQQYMACVVDSQLLAMFILVHILITCMFMFVHIYTRRQCACFILGAITVPDGMTFTVDTDLNGASPQFTLTCISTGGPATTVTWTRDSEMFTGSTVLNDAETAQYTHTLTVTGRLGRLYTCTVANNKPSEDSAQLNVQGMLTVIALCRCLLLIVLFPKRFL